MRIPLALIITAIFLFNASPSNAGQTVKEPATLREFPVTVSFMYEGKEHNMTATGSAVRRKFIFDVYAMVHYMEDPPTGDPQAIFNEILSGSRAKQITMEFVRDVDAEKIQGAFREGFLKNAGKSDLEVIQLLVDQFCGYFKRDVRKDDRIILRWYSDGTVSTAVQGEDKPVISNKTFSRVLWSIWFGEDSIVDRNKLIELITKGGKD